MKDYVFSCLDLFKIYTSKFNIKTTALRGMTLDIKQGEITVILGPSGSGKTTFMKILGLIESQSSGEVIYYSQQQKIEYSKTEYSKRKNIIKNDFGFLSQLPKQNLFFHLTVRENILLPMKIIGKLSKSEQKIRTIELLKSLDLKKRINHKASQLSGGEAQKLGLCIALANDPRIVFCDEPTGELDSSSKLDLLNYIQNLKQELNKTFIIVSHDRKTLNISDKQIEIRNGSVKSIDGLAIT